MTIYGVAIMALATLLGVAIGDILGQLLHVQANVGGVGFAMIFLVSSRVWLEKRNALTPGIKLGVEFWATMYIPIIVAMAAQQNVLAAIKSGPMVLVAGAGSVLASATMVAAISRMGKGKNGSDGSAPEPYIENAAITGPSGPLPDEIPTRRAP